MKDEEVVMNLIVPSGSARSAAIEALKAARAGDFDHADELLAQAREQVLKAHECQSEIIRQELNAPEGEKTGVSLVMVHGQDHLMNAITMCDLAEQIIELTRAAAQ